MTEPQVLDHVYGDADVADELAPDAVLAELTRVLGSPEFRATPQRREMLKFLVEETLAGRGDRLKGYTVGVAVFGREEGYDPQDDPIVRMEARRLRQDLANYYVAAGREDPIRIGIPKGGYVPHFEQQESGSAASEEPVNQKEPSDDVQAGAAALHQKKIWSAAAVFAAIAIVAVLALGQMSHWWTSEREADASIQIPTIAVLPFDVLSTKDDDRFLAIGIATRVVHELQRFADIRIYSSRIDPKQANPSFDPVATGSRLGVSYLVAGSVRSDDSEVEVGVRLIDARSGEIVWTDTYDRLIGPGPLLETQGAIAAEIASALGQPFGVIRNEISARLTDEFVPSMPSYECVLRAYSYRIEFPRALHEPVLSCLEIAVQRDPKYAEAWALLGYMHVYAVAFGHVEPNEFETAFAEAVEAADRARALDPENVMALKALSLAHFLRGDFSESDRYIRLALEKNPNDPDSLAQRGWRLSIRGHFDEGVPLLERAVSRTVKPPGWYYHLLAIDRLLKQDGEGMLAMAENAFSNGSARSYSLVAMAYGLLGDRDAARRALARMKRAMPDYDPVRSWRKHMATEEITNSIAIAMRQAGWPDLDQPATQ